MAQTTKFNSKKAKTSGSKSNNSISKKDIREDITNRIIELLEGGVSAWRKTWLSAARDGFPKNAATGLEYRGVNVLLMWSAAFDAGYSSNKWMTYKQAQAVGAQVRKGEKSITGVYFEMVKKKEAQEGEAAFFPMAKSFSVFNIDQMDNVPAAMLEKPIERTFNPIREAEAFIQDTGAVIAHGGSRAAFSPALDKIIMPEANTFLTEEAYYATVLHELTHWTGHEDRLSRAFGKRFGDDAYAFEELVAELGSAFVCGSLGFVDMTIDNHASYVDSWVKVLKNDKTAIFSAAKHACAAFDYLMSITGRAAVDATQLKAA